MMERRVVIWHAKRGFNRGSYLSLFTSLPPSLPHSLPLFIQIPAHDETQREVYIRWCASWVSWQSLVASPSLPPCTCIMKNKLPPMMTSKVWWSVLPREAQKLSEKKTRWIHPPSLTLRADNGGVCCCAWRVSAVFRHLYMFNEAAACVVKRRSAESPRVPFRKFRHAKASYVDELRKHITY